MCYSGRCNYESYDGECSLCNKPVPNDAVCIQHEMEINICECGIIELIENIIGTSEILGEDVFNVIINQVANCQHYTPITVSDKLPILMRLSIIKEKLKNVEIKYDITGEHKWLNNKCENDIRDIIMEAW